MNLRQVRKKIKSVGNVKKITRAMQLVSAVKMKKAQTVAVEGRPYREKLEQLFHRILPSIDLSISPLMMIDTSKAQKDLVIIISSNKGLCGAFNMTLFRTLMKNTDFKKTDVIAIGKKSAAFASIMDANLIADFSSNTPSNDVDAVFEMALERYQKGEYAHVYIAYNKFISTLRNDSVKEQLLPVELRRETRDGRLEEKQETELEYLIEPNKQEIFNTLLINYLEERVRGAIQNSEASEHSARMIAMKNATDNATDVIYSLTLTRNKLRQQKITYELLDMITAKESVEQ